MRRLLWILAAGFLLVPGVAQGASEPGAQEAPVWQYKHVVDAQYVEQYATVPMRGDVLIIDSRPARKYAKGHIVPAINLSNTAFDANANRLPQDKSTRLIFYCGGLKCPLSHKSAAKAEALGFTNVSVYAAGYPDWVKQGHIPGVSAAYLKQKIDRQANLVIVDARPPRKFGKSHVPTAINIPLRQFDQMLDKLPADKGTELVFYCGGYKCPLSYEAAVKAIAQGYTKVKLFQAGYPAWKAAYVTEPTKAAAHTPVVETGEEEGMITIASFIQLLRDNPDSFYWYDVRDPEEFEVDGGYAKASVMAVDEIEDRADALPADKPIVFFCSTGARAGEAYDIVRMKREDLKVYFLDAYVAFHKDGSLPTVTPPD